ncbi:MAG TPA: sn-glycerol-3-phosphate ABC transporter ATP-binding protein UgpC, partial [Microvirga sp.]|nr:sn-glycerol-3-phosphate ABC transporter ATP-binding protein UgpC [Microvirga sp.]
MAEVVLTGVRKSFGRAEVIHGVDLHIPHGKFVVFVGPSGCGKSTLLRLIAGLEEITDGELLIDGVVVNDRTPKERGIAMVFQSYALYPHMNAYDNMAFGLELSRLSRREIDERVRRVAAMLQIEALLDRKPRDLSGGQRQRVAIGRAIVRDPRVFLFDEPLSNLDAALRVQMRIELAGLHRETGATMIYVTHDQVEAMTLAETIVVLNAGRVEQVGAPLELYHRPENLFVAGFIGSPQMNFWRSEVQHVAAGAVTIRGPGGEDIEIRLSPDELRPGEAVTAGIRPEHAAVGIAERGRTRGRIELIEQLGESHLLYVRTDERLLFTVRASGD